MNSILGKYCKTLPSLWRPGRFGLGVLLFVLGSTTTTHAQNVHLQFTGIRSPKGQVIIKVYVDDKGFEDDKPIRILKYPKQAIANGQMSGTLPLEPGTYGLALLDDENGNSKMEYNMVGMPKEGFGFSDFYLTGLKKPKFHQFKFTLGYNQEKKITMKIRYL